MSIGRGFSAVALAASVVFAACGGTGRASVDSVSAAERAAAVEREAAEREAAERDLAERVSAVAAIAARAASSGLAAEAAAPAVEVKAALPAADNPAMAHVAQTLNNCGPAAVVMALSTLGLNVSQETARLALRGEDLRRGMGPGPVDPWVRENFGLRSMWRNNGTNELMKKLVTNGFAPMVTQWMVEPEVSRISHWRTVRGYDDARGIFIVNDSMLGRGVPLAYDWFAKHWQSFSYRYMVIYRPEDEPRLRAVVGDDWVDAKMRRNFYERAKKDAQAQNTMAAWLTYGEASYQYGFFAEAVAAFERGLAIGSPTGVFTLRSSYPNALRALGRHAEADEATARLTNLTPGVVGAAAAPPDDRIMAVVTLREHEARLAALPEQERPVR